MKNGLRLTLLALCMNASAVFAMPMLSADGSLLTGVDVGGTLYEVMFGDGIVGDVYAGITFDAAREAEASAVTLAMAAALNEIGGVLPDNIPGCVGAPFCTLFNPDRYDSSSDRYRETQSLVSITPGLWEVFGSGFSEASVNSSDVVGLTLVRYSPQDASVPLPAPMLLIGLGLTLLVVRRRQSVVNI